MASDSIPELTFPDAAAFASWLAAQPDDAPGAWVRFAKQAAPGRTALEKTVRKTISKTITKTISKSEAIDCALAHGWIDGQLGRVDEHHFKVRFTPRRPKSAWSQINCARVERLLRAGRMTPRGQSQVDEAKADGRWAAAYAPQGKAAPDAELLAALAAQPAARALFAALDAANRYAVLYRVQQAKTPTKRAAKIAEIVAKLARGETFHPRRTPRQPKTG